MENKLAKKKTKEKKDEVKTKDKVADKRKWADLIDDSQLIVDEVNKIKLVPFKELLRVGNIRGIESVDGDIISPSDKYAAVKVSVKFKDGETALGMACAGPHNVSGKDFACHPVAIAQTRAFSRALRFGLGLTDVCAVEEINFTFLQKKDPNDKADHHQLICIKRLLLKNKLSEQAVLKLSKRKVSSVEELNYGEARKLIEGLMSTKFIKKVKANEE